jgi:hypothetical protein
MKLTNLKKRVKFFKRGNSFFRFLWVMVFILATHKLYAQADIAGEMDLTKKTVNNPANPGSADMFTDADFKLYPNPASNIVYIQAKVKFKEGVVLTLCDIMGNILEKRVLNGEITKNDYCFNLNKYCDGQYIIGILSVDGSRVTKKLIKRG